MALAHAALVTSLGLLGQGGRRLCAFALTALFGLPAMVRVQAAARSVIEGKRAQAEHALQRLRLGQVAECASALVLITDQQDKVVWANPAFRSVSGWSLAEALGCSPDELLAHPRAAQAARARLRQAVHEGQGVRLDCLHQARDGSDLWLDVDLRPLHDEQGQASGFVRVCSDVTSRVQQQGRLAAAWTALPAGVLVQATDGGIVEVNRAAEQMLGMTLAEMHSRDPSAPSWSAVREDGSEVARGELPANRTLASGQAVHGQVVGVRSASGELRWLLCNTQPLRDMTGRLTGVVTCLSDITEQRALLQAELTERSRTDSLTQLPNRSVALERLQHAVAHARRHAGYGFAVLFMDSDHFKQVNDAQGHAAGDALLRQMARRLTYTLRPGDAVARIDSPSSVAARLGGDEFVVVLEGVHDAQVVGVITQRLLEELAQPYLIDGVPVQSTVSIGVVLCTDTSCAGEESVEDFAEKVLRNADTAMYEAKRAGRARWVMFEESMHERLVLALDVERDLRRAIQDDELFVAFQPIVELATREMVAVEALVRWRHPTRGLVGPDEFIGVAEECGLIGSVGAIVLRKACAQFMQWQRTPGIAAPPLLAVNLSRVQAQSVGLVDEVCAALRDFRMRPEQLQLEVTESLAAQDEQVQQTLRELKTLGVRLALDDFGTGYSSLACLHQMPVDTVKIDRGFVEHAETVEYHRVLIEATICVARTLGMTTVAEGIETEGQARMMQELECTRGQGNLFACPMAANAFEVWAQDQFESRTGETV